MATNGQDWDRLAAMLVARRAELGYGGKRRTAFARDRGLSHTRTIDDLENTRRTNFEDATLAQIEQIYGWAPGSIAAVLAGGNPTLADTHPRPPVGMAGSIGEMIQRVYESDLPDEDQRELVRTIRQAEASLRSVEDELAARREKRAAG